MKTPFPKLSALALALSLIAQSCSGPTYVQSSPPPPVYEQAPPPPPQDTYYDRGQNAPPPAPAQQVENDEPAVTYQSFYNELSPYGQWVNTPDYGNVWVPAAGAQFQPYGTDGHWVLTNYGWTWVSDYSWGWAPFHYGRWEFDGLMGWYWIPGYEWSPAWVNWRSCNGYYGWAPLGPNYVNGGYASYSCPPERYVFVNATYINNTNVYSYCVPRNENTTYYSRSTVVSNTYYDRGSNHTYYTGPQSTEVERYTGTPVRPVNIVSASSPGRTEATGSAVRIYRPSVQQPSNASAIKPAPAKVYQKTDIIPVAQRQVLTQPNQPRVTPISQENTQRPANSPTNQQTAPQQRSAQPQQQRPAIQQQQPNFQQQQQAQQQRQAPQQPAQQQRPAMQQQPATPQQPRQQQGQQQRQQPRQQSQPRQQKPVKQQRPAKQQNLQAAPNQKDGGRQ